MARAAKKLVICVDNAGAEKAGQLRVIDESGEDYLAVALPQPIKRAVLDAA
jgi:hypothetical protein